MVSLGDRLCTDSWGRLMTIRDTPTTYSTDEAAQIREVAARRTETVFCPRCKSAMDRGPRVEVHGSLMEEICCPQCQRCVMLRTRPEE
jgi:hypothetical protein